MKCPFCNSHNNKVTDSREREDGYVIWRRRLCLDCGKKFSTYERVESVPIVVIKRDGKKELFQKEKALGGLLRACKKRPVKMEILEEIVSELESNLKKQQKTEVTTKEIGEFLINKLRDIDLVAYIRFASVYKEFSNVSDFIKEVNNVVKNKNGEQK